MTTSVTYASVPALAVARCTACAVRAAAVRRAAAMSIGAKQLAKTARLITVALVDCVVEVAARNE